MRRLCAIFAVLLKIINKIAGIGIEFKIDFLKSPSLVPTFPADVMCPFKKGTATGYWMSRNFLFENSHSERCGIVC